MRRLSEQSNAPVILVTAKDSDSDKVRGLELGADDYIVKPFSPDELGARIRAVLRRTGKQIAVPASATKEPSRDVIHFGQWVLDLKERELMTKDGKSRAEAGATGGAGGWPDKTTATADPSQGGAPLFSRKCVEATSHCGGMWSRS